MGMSVICSANLLESEVTKGIAFKCKREPHYIRVLKIPLSDAEQDIFRGEVHYFVKSDLYDLEGNLVSSDWEDIMIFKNGFDNYYEQVQNWKPKF